MFEDGVRRKTVILTPESQGLSCPGDPETSWGHNRLCSPDSGLGEHMLVLWNGQRNFPCLYSCGSLTPSSQGPPHELLGKQKQNAMSGKIPQLWCLFPCGELQRAEPLFSASSFLADDCWLLRDYLEELYSAQTQSSSLRMHSFPLDLMTSQTVRYEVINGWRWLIPSRLPDSSPSLHWKLGFFTALTQEIEHQRLECLELGRCWKGYSRGGGNCGNKCQ